MNQVPKKQFLLTSLEIIKKEYYATLELEKEYLDRIDKHLDDEHDPVLFGELVEDYRDLLMINEMYREMIAKFHIAVDLKV